MKPARAAREPRAMTVAGVMSGTSADGVDVAVVRIKPGTNTTPQIKLLGHRSFPYTPALRERILAAMDASTISVAELARLNWRLGQVYADCIASTCAALNIGTTGSGPLALIGMHGQTIYHQPTAQEYAGTPVRATWQTGEPAVLRERLGMPVVSDFRPADLAAGGQGAPLVPMLDFCLFGSPTRNRILLNLGGIANVTVLPAAAEIDQITAFDTGPANMVIDALATELYNRPYDREGEIAASGCIVPSILDALLANAYFSAPPPKSCGREQFGRTFTSRLLKSAKASNATDADVIATATELTVRSIVLAVESFCIPAFSPTGKPAQLIVAGGGARNRFLIERLQHELKQQGIQLLLADQLGLPSEAKEAVAFALLAWLSWHGLPGNIPSATGAARPTILGKVTC